MIKEAEISHNNLWKKTSSIEMSKDMLILRVKSIARGDIIKK